MHLLDTAVVTELRRPRSTSRPETGTLAWAASLAPQSLFISAITLHELESTAATVAKRDRTEGALWRSWLDEQVARAFEGRVLAVDAAIVRRAATMGYADQRDGLIAATALEHGLTLATARPRAFKAGKVRLFEPAQYAPAGPTVDDWRQASLATPAWVKNLFVRS